MGFDQLDFLNPEPSGKTTDLQNADRDWLFVIEQEAYNRTKTTSSVARCVIGSSHVTEKTN